MSAVPEVSEAAIEAAARRLCGDDADPACAGCTHRARAALAAAAPEIARAAKVEALREAVLYLAEGGTYGSVSAWLDDRADDIERGESS